MTVFFKNIEITIAAAFAVVTLMLAGAAAASAAPASEPCYTRQDLSARASGFVDRVLATEGQQVKAGDVIAELDNRFPAAAVREAQAGVDAAAANVDLAKDTHTRLLQLAAANTVAPQELFNAAIHVRQAEAQLAQARAGLERAKAQMADTRIKAEIDGRVSGLPQVKGLYVQAGHPLGRVEAQASRCAASNN